ncbi:MAG: DNA-binding response regulator [Flavobacteriales bacterium CG_4_9_14_3_um_filter_40_17]|nr:MAG: DNA-binding response regulator [Flavobacteriales bacterium CG_4_9_14_3_um_filter_40_17]
MIRIVIAEDHQALIDGITLLLMPQEDIRIVGTANDGERLIEVVRKLKPQLVLTDIRMPKMDGIAATKIIKKEFPEIKVIAFSMFDQDEAVRQMVEAGASGYLLKNSGLAEVKEAIYKVAAGRLYFDAGVNTGNQDSRNINKTGEEPLSQRQLEILKLVGQGLSNIEISEKLFIGRTTVETHRKNMISKLGLQGSGELMRYALERKYDF